jgi:hypothetical protein
MSNMSSKFAILSALAGIMLFSIWSNIYAYAQQSSAPAVPASSPPIGSSLTNSLSPELKAKMCDPSNPSLKVVNTTEAHICGIPKTVKPSLPAATPPTSAVSSSTAIAPQIKAVNQKLQPPIIAISDNSGSEDKSKCDTKLRHIKEIIATDNDSSGKKRTKSDRTDSTSEDVSSKDTCDYHYNSIITIKTCY